MTSNKKLIILLPPSEGKALSGATGTKFIESNGTFGKSLGKQRTIVIAALRDARGGSPKLLGVSGAHLARAQQANLAVRGAKTLPASQRYTGVVWDHLDLGSLPLALKILPTKILSSFLVCWVLLRLVIQRPIIG